MLSERLIDKIKIIVEDTVVKVRAIQGHFNSVYQLNNLPCSSIFNQSAELSYQLEHALITNLPNAEKGRGYEDVLYNGVMPLEVKVASRPTLQVSVKHKVQGKTYIMAYHKNLFLKAIYFLPYAKDYYFKPPSPNAHTRIFNSKYNNLLFKILYP